MGWTLAPQSIELANKIYPHPEAVRFLNDFLHQVTGIMLDQVLCFFVFLCRREPAVYMVRSLERKGGRSKSVVLLRFELDSPAASMCVYILCKPHDIAHTYDKATAKRATDEWNAPFAPHVSRRHTHPHVHTHVAAAARPLSRENTNMNTKMTMKYQSVSKMDLHNKKCAFSTLEATAKVLPALLQDGRKQFLDTVVLLVDQHKGLYSGQKAMWTHIPGAPEVSAS